MPFVVFGASKSGTTWLQKLIDTHPEVSCHFQRPILPINRNDVNLFHPGVTVYSSRKTPFSGLLNSDEEEQYLAELNFLNETMGKISSNLNSHNPLVRKSFEQYAKRFITSILYKEGASACGTKSYTNLNEFIKLFPQGKVISIARDPRDVIVSKRFHTLRMGVFFHGDERYRVLHFLNRSEIFRRFVRSRYHNLIPIVRETYFRATDAEGKLHVAEQALYKYAYEWIAVNKYLLSFKENYSDNHLIIKYEDLKKDPNRILSSVFEFLEVENSPEVISEIIDIGKTSRVKKGKDSFFRKGVTGDYLNHLNADQIEWVNATCNEVANELGYNLD